MEVESLKDFLLWKPKHEPYIISSDILPVGCRMMIHGRYGSWKSMLAMHTGACISSGSPWFGYQTTKVPVLYTQFEIPKANLQRRLIKYSEFNPVCPDNMFISTEHFIKFDTAYGISDLERIVARTGAKVLIVDPLYRVVSGHITDNYDSTRLIDNIEIIRAKYSLAVIVVHHNRKIQSFNGEEIDREGEEASGNQNFANWVDTNISIRPIITDGHFDNSIEIRFTKSRNSEYDLSPVKVVIDRETLKFKEVRAPVKQVTTEEVTIRNLEEYKGED